MKTGISVGQAIERYLHCRRQLGFALKAQGRILRSLGRYCKSVRHRGPLTNKLVLQWVQLPSTASPIWWARRLSVARHFALFWVVFEPRTEIPPTGLFGPETARSPVHLYTREEIMGLLQATDRLRSRSHLSARTYRTVFGLLSSTGLRISEALRLQNGDIDWFNSTLRVRRSKFGKSRCLPLDNSVLEALRIYARRRDRGQSSATSSRTFFVNTKGRPLSYSQAGKTFRSLRTQLGWQQRPLPRIHDLRHTFVVQTLLRWSGQKEAVAPKILALTTYLVRPTG